MKALVYNLEGERVREADLPESVFGIEPNRGVMHQALLRQLANSRRGTAQTQTRSEVSRTTKKWFRQKGTGRARHGSRTANLFVGGAVSHGPQHRSYRQAMPRQMRRLALRSALSARAADSAVAVIEGLAMDAPKTRLMRDLVAKVCGGSSTLVLLGSRNENVERSIKNLPNVRYLRAGYLNVRDVLGYERVLIDAEALDGIVSHLAGGHDEAETEEATNASD